MYGTRYLLFKTKAHASFMDNLSYLHLTFLLFMQKRAILSHKSTTFITLNIIIISFLGHHSSLFFCVFFFISLLALRLSPLLFVLYILPGNQV